jgi:hypothetical protein
MVKKLEKGATVTCFKCHQEGHKSYKCPQHKKMVPDRRTRRASPSRVLLSTPSPIGETRAKAPPMSSRRRAMARWLPTRLGRKIGVGTAPKKSSPT